MRAHTPPTAAGQRGQNGAPISCPTRMVVLTQEFLGLRRRQESGRYMLQTAPRDPLQPRAWLGTAGRQPLSPMSANYAQLMGGFQFFIILVTV